MQRSMPSLKSSTMRCRCGTRRRCAAVPVVAFSYLDLGRTPICSRSQRVDTEHPSRLPVMFDSTLHALCQLRSAGRILRRFIVS